MLIKFLIVTVGILVLVNLSLAVCKEEQYIQVVTQAEKDQIVQEHNDYRIQIANDKVVGQPRGINLKRLKWDANLAAEAQIIANACEFAHVTVEDPRFYVGQNLAITTSTGYDNNGADWKTAVAKWFEEHKYFNYPDISISNSVTGHYTQVVWANTEYVGCGFSYHLDSTSGSPYQKLYVCNYGPGGNYVGQAPYQTGTSGCENLC